MPDIGMSAAGLTEQEPNVGDVRLHVRAFRRHAAAFSAGGMLGLSAIVPDGPAVSRNFPLTEEGQEQAVRWAEARNRERRNVYIRACTLCRTIGKADAPTNKDVSEAAFVVVDFDRAADALDRITSLPVKPRFIVTTGTVPHLRVHAWWALASATSDLTAWEATMVGLATSTGADQNIAKRNTLVRLAGTVSFPTAKKRARGYTTELTTVRVMDGGSKTASLEDLRGMCGKARSAEGDPATAEVDDDDWTIGAGGSQEPDLELTRQAAERLPNDGPANWDAWKAWLMAFFATGGEEARDDALTWSRKNLEHDDAEFNKAWNEILRSPPNNTGPGKLRKALDAIDRAPDDSRYQLLGTLERKEPPRLRWLWKGVLARASTASVIGMPGAAKSFFVVYLAFRISRGEPAFGVATEKGLVLYIAPEDPWGVSSRMRALEMVHGDAPDLLLLTGVSDFLNEKSPDRAFVRKLVEERKPALVIVDTLRSAAPGLKENAAEEMSRIVSFLGKLAKETAAAVVVVHHTPKAGGDTGAGSGVFDGDHALRVLVEKEGDNLRRGTLAKHRNGPIDPPPVSIAFTIHSKDIGANQDGDRIVAGYVVEASAPPKRAGPNLTKAQAAALKVFREMEPWSESITKADWRKECERKGTVTEGSTAESIAARIRTVTMDLIRLGYIHADGEHCTLASRGDN